MKMACIYMCFYIIRTKNYTSYLVQYIQDMKLSAVIFCFVSRVLVLILASNDITVSLSISAILSLYYEQDVYSWKLGSCYT
jgi:hypothetical protein